jgi:hypothetical protein
MHLHAQMESLEGAHICIEHAESAMLVCDVDGS